MNVADVFWVAVDLAAAVYLVKCLWPWDWRGRRRTVVLRRRKRWFE